MGGQAASADCSRGTEPSRHKPRPGAGLALTCVFNTGHFLEGPQPARPCPVPSCGKYGRRPSSRGHRPGQHSPASSAQLRPAAQPCGTLSLPRDGCAREHGHTHLSCTKSLPVAQTGPGGITEHRALSRGTATPESHQVRGCGFSSSASVLVSLSDTGRVLQGVNTCCVCERYQCTYENTQGLHASSVQARPCGAASRFTGVSDREGSEPKEAATAAPASASTSAAPSHPL